MLCVKYSLAPVYVLGQITLTVLGLVDYGSRHGNDAPTQIRGETSETDHIHQQRSCKYIVLSTRQ